MIAVGTAGGTQVEGEESTSEIAEQHSDRRAVLARLPLGWTVLHDLPWPGRAGAQLDHLALGPAGVFAFVVGDDDGEAGAAGDAVARLVPGLPRRHVYGVLVGADRPAPWPDVDGVILCESVDVTRMLRSRPAVLTAEEVAGVVGVVHVGLERAAPTSGRVAGPAQGLVTDYQAVAEVRRRLRLRRRRPGDDRG
jgi:hypothetical protein